MKYPLFLLEIYSVTSSGQHGQQWLSGAVPPAPTFGNLAGTVVDVLLKEYCRFIDVIYDVLFDFIVIDTCFEDNNWISDVS